MRLRVVASEAWRNLASGAVAVWLVVPALAMAVAALTVPMLMRAREAIDRDAAQRASGALALKVSGSVDGARCDAVTVNPRHEGSGAFRTAAGISLVVAPTRPLALIEVTPGLATMLGLADTEIGLATTPAVGIVASGEMLLSSDDGALRVAAVLTPPTWLTNREWVAISIVPAVGVFESCVVARRAIDDADPAELLSVAATTSGVDPQIERLVPDAGAPVDEARALEGLLGERHRAACIGSGILVALLATWVRRRHIAIARQFGVSRVSIGMTHFIEGLVWVPASLVVAAPFVWSSIRVGTTTRTASYLAEMALVPTLLTALLVLLGVAVLPAMIRGRAVLRYLKEF
jgi:hypothetical protein